MCFEFFFVVRLFVTVHCVDCKSKIFEVNERSNRKKTIAYFSCAVILLISWFILCDGLRNLGVSVCLNAHRFPIFLNFLFFTLCRAIGMPSLWEYSRSMRTHVYACVGLFFFPSFVIILVVMSVIRTKPNGQTNQWHFNMGTHSMWKSIINVYLFLHKDDKS